MGGALELKTALLAADRTHPHPLHPTQVPRGQYTKAVTIRLPVEAAQLQFFADVNKLSP